MAVVAAGGGLLIAAASAVPAYATATGTPAAPPRGHTITIQAHPRAGGIGPHDVLPCAVKPGARPASCGDKTISCTIAAANPFVTLDSTEVGATVTVQCTASVTAIALIETLTQNGTDVADSNVGAQNSPLAISAVSAPCQDAAVYQNHSGALITFPPGYVITGGRNPIVSASLAVQLSCDPGGGGDVGGHGGGCAVHAPSAAGHPAGRHPDFITCS